VKISDMKIFHFTHLKPLNIYVLFYTSFDILTYLNRAFKHFQLLLVCTNKIFSKILVFLQHFQLVLLADLLQV
jgi:hypothetical protein